MAPINLFLEKSQRVPERNLRLIFIEASKNKSTDPASVVRLRRLIGGGVLKHKDFGHKQGRHFWLPPPCFCNKSSLKSWQRKGWKWLAVSYGWHSSRLMILTSLLRTIKTGKLWFLGQQLRLCGPIRAGNSLLRVTDDIIALAMIMKTNSFTCKRYTNSAQRYERATRVDSISSHR